MDKGKKVAVPLLTYARHEERIASGKVSNGMLVTEDRETGRLSFGAVTDVTEACAKSCAGYAPLREALPLDFGLSTLFASDEGDLLGHGWLATLKRYDRRIIEIARSMQRRGLKPRRSRRYREEVEDLRGFIETEVNRVLNRLVKTKKPVVLLLERLDFRNQDLSARLNRIVQNCGRAVVKAKLADLEDRFGIRAEEVNPTYTSQTCLRCGHVDKRNRRDQSTFQCPWCARTMHAEGNAARNIGERRADSIGSVYRPKAAILDELVRRFVERQTGAFRSVRSGGRGSTADPRLSNPYFKGLVHVARISRGTMALLHVVVA